VDAHATTGRSRGARSFLLAALLVAAVVAVPAPALAAIDNAQSAVGGANSKWFSGTLDSQDGENCSIAIIGSAYSEPMVVAIAGYGGAPGGQIVKVGDRYYANVLISIPGNPCGPGSSVVGTDLVLPRGTSVDTGAPIRCFGEPRNTSSFVELTGGGWSFNGFSGPYCPASVGPSLTGTAGAVGVGFRPLASGQLYELFVPITSTQTLVGAGTSPADEIRWVLSSSGTYTNVHATSVWANVVPAASGTPYIYFARDPSAQPYWVESPTDGGPKSRIELFANLYSAGKAGTLCWELYEPDPAHDSAPFRCDQPAFAPTWNSAITTASDTWQVTGGGPNGGYALGFDPMIVPPGQQFTMRWIFTPSSGPPVSKDIAFNMIAGPDADGDGVPDAGDACPGVKGSQSNGCAAPVQTDPDGDGLFGAADKCPAANGAGALDGCPPAVIVPISTTTIVPPPPPPPVRAPTLRTGKASATVKGATITIATGLSVSCPAGGASCPVAVSATITAAQAAKARPKPKKPVVAGSVRRTVAAGRTVAITFKLSAKAASALKRHKRLTISLTGSASTGATGPKTRIAKSISVSAPKARKH
jgi:hypothetical protein